MSYLEPTISVVLPSRLKPSYASVRNLVRAIDSVLDQSFPSAFELILLDDNSLVPVAELLEYCGYKIPTQVKVIRRKRGNGLVQALNFGLLVSKYNYIARMDDDDLWLTEKLSSQIDLFKEDPDLTITSTGMRLFYKESGETRDLIRPNGWSDIIQFFCNEGCPFAHGSVIARRDIYNLLGGYPQSAIYNHCEDYALWEIWIRFFKPGMLKKIGYEYTVSKESVSGQNAVKQRTTSALINKRFSALGLAAVVPSRMHELALKLNISLLLAGVLVYRLWHYMPSVVLPESVISLIGDLLPDRHIRIVPINHHSLTVSDVLQDFYEFTEMIVNGKLYSIEIYALNIYQDDLITE